MSTANSIKAVPLHVLKDLEEWINLGIDLEWWHAESPDSLREEQPETWALAQRVAKHLLALDSLPINEVEVLS